MIGNKGVSVISLVITIIVLIIITSVTVFNGIKMVDQTRVTQAMKRLEGVADAVISHEKELGYAETLSSNLSGDYLQIGVDDYRIMGLTNFANTDDFPPILIRKTVDPNDPSQKVYELKTPKLVKKTNVYVDDDYVSFIVKIYDDAVQEHYKVEFDEAKGVNRPILTAEMAPIKSYMSSDKDAVPVLAEDMYTTNWYNYSKESPMWANVMIKDSANVMYVWIPRFGYFIQDIYKGKDWDAIPSSAIDIKFLRGTSDLMANEEILPKEYQVHPAFQYKDVDGNKVDLPGFWVRKENIDFADQIVSGTGVVACDEVKLSNLHPNMNPDEVDSHLIKNTEWAAIAYLSMYTVGPVDNGNSLKNSSSGVMELDEKAFVAGGLNSTVRNTIPYADRYYRISGPTEDQDLLTYDSYEGYSGDGYGHSQGRKFGDAMIVTSSGNSENSAWYYGTSIKISNSQPYIIRGLDSNLFSYAASSNNPERGAMYRNVLVVKDR